MNEKHATQLKSPIVIVFVSYRKNNKVPFPHIVKCNCLIVNHTINKWIGLNSPSLCVEKRWRVCWDGLVNSMTIIILSFIGLISRVKWKNLSCVIMRCNVWLGGHVCVLFTLFYCHFYSLTKITRNIACQNSLRPSCVRWFRKCFK